MSIALAAAPSRPSPSRLSSGITPTHVLLMVALACGLVAGAVTIWGLPALVMVALPLVPLMFLWFLIIPLP